VLPVLADVSKPDEVNHVVQQGLDRFGKIDISVSVAAYGATRISGPSATRNGWKCLRSTCIRLFFWPRRWPVDDEAQKRQHHRARRAGVHDVAAAAGARGGVQNGPVRPDQVAGAGARALRHTRNLIALSLIVNKRLNPEWYPEGKGDPRTQADIDGTALKREGTREEVANVALFLASDLSSYVTGDRIICAGGKYM